MYLVNLKSLVNQRQIPRSSKVTVMAANRHISFLALLVWWTAGGGNVVDSFISPGCTLTYLPYGDEDCLLVNIVNLELHF